MNVFRSFAYAVSLVAVAGTLGAFGGDQGVSVPRGAFTMGSSCASCKEDERPPHTVTMSSFTMDKNEVTIGQYDSCVASGKCTPEHFDDGQCMLWTSGRFRNVLMPKEYRDPRYPVVCVTWYQARRYCTVKGGKLPTEAQWEYAAGSGAASTYAWGNDPPGPNRCANQSSWHASATGSFSPNNWGLNDMTGNVWEWTADFYDREYYAISPDTDPQGPEVGLYRVIRGGGWYSGPEQLRLTNRNWFSPDFSEASIGFRCVY
jgi:formylglycine-generating enzyme required for sulfatase activity